MKYDEGSNRIQRAFAQGPDVEVVDSGNLRRSPPRGPDRDSAESLLRSLTGYPDQNRAGYGPDYGLRCLTDGTQGNRERSSPRGSRSSSARNPRSSLHHCPAGCEQGDLLKADA